MTPTEAKLNDAANKFWRRMKIGCTLYCGLIILCFAILVVIFVVIGILATVDK